MSVEAVYRHGFFEPLSPVQLGENQHVRLNIEPISGEDVQAWLVKTRELQAAIARRNGPLPDSATDIATDRAR